MAIEMDVRVSKLEQWRDTADEGIRELKTQLNETVKKSDLERLENKLDERDHNYMKNLWRLVFSLIVVFTGILLAAVGLGVNDLPGLFGG